MNIVVEGPDGSGKSTLCKFLAQRLGRPIIPGEGPSKHPGEFDERIQRMLGIGGSIFDRHPAVSGPIYNMFRDPPQDWPSHASQQDFYASSPIILYCHPTGVTQHAASNETVDTPSYLEWLDRYQWEINSQYEQWALRHAHVIYRVGDNLDQLVYALKGMCRED